ncbi:MAG: hypothetical protein K2J83_06220, partial [Clostridia bacterium]|nr:hypothetical protein [Clostridia bacterium]
YLKNADNLVEKLNNLINSLEEVKSAIARGDSGWLCEILRNGKESYSKGKKNLMTSDIFVQNLK